jgi:putative PIN family toxin of toxin-antitoxin system
MTPNLRTVIDTSVAVSAVLLRRSIPRQAIDFAAERGQLLASEATIEELEEVLRRPVFEKYVSERARLEFLAALVDQAEVVPITFHTSECRDAKDNKFLELAVSGRATHIVSGDGDLLVLNPFHEIAIINPEEFLRSLKPDGGH